MTYSKYWKEKNTPNQKFSTQQNPPSNMKEKYRHFQINKAASWPTSNIKESISEWKIWLDDNLSSHKEMMNTEIVNM